MGPEASRWARVEGAEVFTCSEPEAAGAAMGACVLVVSEPWSPAWGVGVGDSSASGCLEDELRLSTGVRGQGVGI